VVVILILGGAGRLYGGLVGAIIFMVARDQFSGSTPQFWYFWIGILLVAVGDVPAERHSRAASPG
jgi:branched-chain amino acid transport system permease protein